MVNEEIKENEGAFSHYALHFSKTKLTELLWLWLLRRKTLEIEIGFGGETIHLRSLLGEDHLDIFTVLHM